ncbi:MAG: hypothetical protein WBG86_01865 [Polyangiales bacterium]
MGRPAFVVRKGRPGAEFPSSEMGAYDTSILSEEQKVRRGEGGTNSAARGAYMPAWGADDLSDQELQMIADYLGTQ